MNGCIYCNKFDVCEKYTTDEETSFCVGRNCRDRKESNSDRIRSMTDEELAEFLDVKYWEFNQCKPDAPVDDETKECLLPDCKACWLEWLKRESEDEW